MTEMMANARKTIPITEHRLIRFAKEGLVSSVGMWGISLRSSAIWCWHRGDRNVLPPGIAWANPPTQKSPEPMSKQPEEVDCLLTLDGLQLVSS